MWARIMFHFWILVDSQCLDTYRYLTNKTTNVARRAVFESASKNRINCFLCLWNKLLLVGSLHWKKLYLKVATVTTMSIWEESSGSEVSLEEHLTCCLSFSTGSNFGDEWCIHAEQANAKYFVEEMPWLTKCLKKKSININCKKRDLASTKPVV